MEVIAIATVASAVSFAAGVVFHKYVISEAQTIKQHVTEEVDALRAELSTGIANFAKKV